MADIQSNGIIGELGSKVAICMLLIVFIELNVFTKVKLISL
jgi:hypothetical protein